MWLNNKIKIVLLFCSIFTVILRNAGDDMLQERDNVLHQERDNVLRRRDDARDEITKM